MPFFRANTVFSDATLWRFFPNWMENITGTWVPDDLELERGVIPPPVIPDWAEPEPDAPTEPRRPRGTDYGRTPAPVETGSSVNPQMLLIGGLLLVMILKK